MLKLAWRNIWRNRRRSLIVLASVAIGILATVLTDALSRGMVYQMLENQIGSHVSHLQVHRAGFNKNPVIQSTVPESARVEQILGDDPDVRAYSRRILTFGIISSASSSAGVSFVGIEPEEEASVTTIHRSIAVGTYLSGNENEIVIGTKLAEKLDVGIGDKVVGMASSEDGRVGSDLFRVVGLYETVSSEFDRAFVYVSLKGIRSMVSLGDEVSEFAVVVNDIDRLSVVTGRVRNSLSDNYEVLPYPEVLPLLIMQIDVYADSMIIFYAIIAVAVIFGIVNTMLMAVYERIQEFGVLKSVGMKNSRLFVMIVTEAFLLGSIGSLVGFVLAWLIYLPLSATGIDLGLFSASLRSFGVGTVIYPVLTWDIAANALLVIPFVTVLGSIYPAFKVVRLEPVAALRYI